MKFAFRWAFRFLILFLVLGITLALLKNALLKSWMEGRIRSETGMQAKIGKLEAGLFSPTLLVENLKLYNSPEFGGSIFVDMPELFAEYDRSLLRKGRVHITLLRLNLAELHVVRNQAGKVNIEPLGVTDEPSTNTTSATSQFAGIDVLNLSVGSLKYRSLSQTNKEKEVKLALKNEIIRNVKSPEDLQDLIRKILWNNGHELMGGL